MKKAGKTHEGTDDLITAQQKKKRTMPGRISPARAKPFHVQNPTTTKKEAQS
jgi:hypothetical protein